MSDQSGKRRLFPIRTAARALIQKNGRILVTRYLDSKGEWYTLPGGGQRHGEALSDCVRRECHEEIGCDVRVGPMRFVRECVADRDDAPGLPPGFHQVEVIFECELIDAGVMMSATAPDPGQAGWTWLDTADLASKRFFPRCLADLWRREDESPEMSQYLGVVR